MKRSDREAEGILSATTCGRMQKISGLALDAGEPVQALNTASGTLDDNPVVRILSVVVRIFQRGVLETVASIGFPRGVCKDS